MTAPKNTKSQPPKPAMANSPTPSRIIPVIVMLGVVFGIGAGLLYAWKINPRILTDIRPAQLSEKARRDYIIAISLAYTKDRRIEIAGSRLAAMNATWGEIADTACDLSKTGYASTNTGQIAIRAMVDLAASQGATGCASQFIPQSTGTPTFTPTYVPPTETRIPPPTKTPTPTLGVTYTPEPIEITPTAVPAGDYVVTVASFCSPDVAGVIEILVQNPDSSGIPAVAVEISNGEQRQTFFTGLKPERDPGYADYKIEDDKSYTVGLRDFRGSDRSRALQAVSCNVQGGGTSKASYRVFFKRVPN